MPAESHLPTTGRYTGSWTRRREDPRLLTGLGNYVDDLKVPGALHAAFVRSLHAHARILHVDATRAL